MASLQRQRVIWTGFTGGPGVSTFYFETAITQQAALRTLLVDLAGRIPGVVTLQIETGGDIIDDASGLLLGTWVGNAQAPIQGGYTGTYSAPSGFCIRWETGIVNGGHHVRGRTYVVPAGTNALENNGTLNPLTVAEAAASATTFIQQAPSNFRVWKRPRAASNAWTDVHGVTHAAQSYRPGVSAAVTLASVPDKVVVLRSRRD